MSDETQKTRLINRPVNIPPPSNIPSEDQPTQMASREPAPSDDIPTRRIRDDASSDAPTRMINRDVTAHVPPEDEGKTVLIRPGRAKTEAFHPMAPAAAPVAEEPDPVVGWLIVLKGPGRGNAVKLGYGWNSIGRDASQRARIDFGDAQISRVNHARVLYDPKARKFTLTLGESPNPIYVREEAVLGPTKLENNDHILVGETTLLFHSLCGENFDWQDLE